jgi:aminoglycoside 6'-N-acetyltransferase I
MKAQRLMCDARDPLRNSQSSVKLIRIICLKGSLMIIRPLSPMDSPEWLRMRKALWPDCSEEIHAIEMKEQTDSTNEATFVLERGNGKLGGFVEVSIRDRVDGAVSPRAGYIEGWYVDPDLRRQGMGRELVATAERWAASTGMTEMGSDAELDNGRGIRAHKALGYQESFRLVHFLKRLEQHS